MYFGFRYIMTYLPSFVKQRQIIWRLCFFFKFHAVFIIMLTKTKFECKINKQQKVFTIKLLYWSKICLACFNLNNYIAWIQTFWQKLVRASFQTATIMIYFNLNSYKDVNHTNIRYNHTRRLLRFSISHSNLTKKVIFALDFDGLMITSVQVLWKI